MPRGSSIERIVLLMQSSSKLVGFILRALGFGNAADANQYFAFRFRHPEKVNQPVEVGRDRQGFELGGHVCDVASDVEHFPRHSPMRRIVRASRRSRGSELSASPTFGFVSQEAYSSYDESAARLLPIPRIAPTINGIQLP
jgi:hypothetical protein